MGRESIMGPRAEYPVSGELVSCSAALQAALLPCAPACVYVPKMRGGWNCLLRSLAALLSLCCAAAAAAATGASATSFSSDSYVVCVSAWQPFIMWDNNTNVITGYEVHYSCKDSTQTTHSHECPTPLQWDLWIEVQAKMNLTRINATRR